MEGVRPLAKCLGGTLRTLTRSGISAVSPQVTSGKRACPFGSRVLGVTGTAPGTLDSGAVQLLGRRDRVVLAALAVSRPAAVSQQQLAEALWPDGPPASAAKNVQGCISRLRTQFGSDMIATLESGYVLSRHAVTAADRFEQGVVRAGELLRLGQADRAAFLVDERLRDWAGTPYDELDHWPPAAAENTRLNELRLYAEELLVDASLEAGELRRAAVQAHAFAEAEPLRERRWAQVAVAEYRLGQQAAALEALRCCREHLADELGIDPAPEIADLEVAILRQDPALASAGAQPDDGLVAECPWPGLSAYGPDEEESFFGRDDDIVTALGILDARGNLVVVGPSGIGKSSFVSAGLIPALQARGWSVHLTTPSMYAFAAGGGALGSPVDVIAIDQAEELFTLPDADRDALLDRLDAHPGPRVIAMRADQMPQVAGHPGLARLVENGLFLLGGLSTAGLTAAIEQPASQRGLLVEPGLVDLLLRDLEGEPGALPLFSHALAQTWTHREGRSLTVAGYRAAGGVRGAVARSAERVYSAADASDRTALRSLMLRLVSTGSEGEPRRERVRTDHLTDAEHRRLVDSLVQARLLTRDADTVTLTHEALVDAWPRLRDWLDEDVDGRRVFHHLAAAALAWDELGRPDSELYRGVRLARVLSWAQTQDLALSEIESDFLAAAQRLADVEAHSLADQIRRQRRTNRVLRSLLAGLAIVLVAALLAGVLARVQARRADRQSLAATATAVGTKALNTDDPQLALLLAAAATDVSPNADTLRSLSGVMGPRPSLTRMTSVPDSAEISATAVAANTVLTVDRRHVVRSFDSELRPGPTFDAGDGSLDVLDPALAAGEHVVAVGASPGDPRPVRLLDAQTLTELPTTLHGISHPVYVVSLAMSGDGSKVAAVYTAVTTHSPLSVHPADTRMRVWDVATGQPAGPEVKLAGPIVGAALSAHGATVFTSSPVAAYDVATGAVRWKTRSPTGNSSIATRWDLLAVPTVQLFGQSAGVRLYDTSTGRVRTTLAGDLGQVRGIAFADHGLQLAATGSTGLAIVWTLGDMGLTVSEVMSDPLTSREDSELARLLKGDTQVLDTGGTSISNPSFSAYGGRLHVATGLEPELQTWNVTGLDEFLRALPAGLIIPSYFSAGARFSPDGSRLVMDGQVADGSTSRSLSVFNLKTRTAYDVPAAGARLVTEETPPALVPAIPAGAWNPAGDRYAAGDDHGWVQVIDAVAGRERTRRRVTDGRIAALAYAGNSHLAVATEDGHLLLLDAETLDEIGMPVALDEGIADLAGFDDGHTVLALGTARHPAVSRQPENKTWYRIDLAGGRVTQTGQLAMRNGLALALAPDETYAAFGGSDGKVEFVDLHSGRPTVPTASNGTEDVTDLVFNDSGTRLATTSPGRQIGLWDARAGTPLAIADVPTTMELQTVSFTSGGRVLAATTDGPVYVWDTSPQAAVRYACKVAGRNLTRHEWADAFGDVPYRRVCTGI
jgi:DNA-binding SARP family transcriptional activator/WD40 repeat protein